MDFRGKRVLIIGLARQGKALARFFCRQGAQVTITDAKTAAQLQEAITELEGLPVRYVLGGHPLSLLDGCDLLCLSGGVPPEIPFVQEAERRGIPLSNDSLLTLYLAPTPMIGITGSSGKTTTTALVGEILKAAGFPTWVGGNIGTPLIDRLESIRPGDKMVLELSSFQLQLFDASPWLGAVLNITPNHLDRHPSMGHYTAAKANILRYQGPEDVAVLGTDNPVTRRWWEAGEVHIPADVGQEEVRFPLRGRVVGFGLRDEAGEGAFLRGETLVLRLDGREQPVCTVNEVRLRGMHNVANLLAACAIAGVAGADTAAMREVARTFTGVPHRLELVREIDGVRWYNDSIATTPERVVAALRSFDEPIVLLAGGRDKHLPWDEMARLTRQKVRHLVVFGEAANLIAGAVEGTRNTRNAARDTQHVVNGEWRMASDEKEPMAGQRWGRGPVVHRCRTLEEAVEVAARVARPGDVVLLSPGGTSFDAFRDFEERGERFRELVRGLEG